VLYEETTGTLLCGDLFSQVGRGLPLTTSDIVGPALVAEKMFHQSSLSPNTVSILRALGDLNPTTLAVMHGSSFTGDCRQAIYDLADGYQRLSAAAA
jgi:hypothetical protein